VLHDSSPYQGKEKKIQRPRLIYLFNFKQLLIYGLIMTVTLKLRDKNVVFIITQF